MASLLYDAGRYELRGGGAVAFTTDVIEYILVKSTYTPSRADTGTVLATAEISGVTGYTGGYAGAGRKALGTKSITNDTTNHRTSYLAADPSAYTLGAGDTIGGVIVAKKGAASDATAVLLAFLELADTVSSGFAGFTLAGAPVFALTN
jgi:hypothetical protein